MQKENPIWKIISICLTIVTIASSFFFYYDAKRSTEHKIVEALSERYETVDREMTYEQALEAVDRDMAILKNNNAALQLQNDELHNAISSLQLDNDNLESEISSLNNEIKRSETIALAESYANSGNYAVAIPILNSVSEKDEAVTALLKDYIANYEISIIREAQLLANNGNYDEAISLITDALKIVPNSQALTEKKNNITPKYLVDAVECYKAENLWRLDSRESIKMSGKSYRHAIFSQSSDVVGSMFNNSYSANAFYNLDGRYSQLSGVVGHIDFSGSGTIGVNDAGQVYDAEITIWGDDTEIYTIVLSSNDAAKEFNVTVVGVKILEFQIKCGGNSKVGIAEIQIR